MNDTARTPRSGIVRAGRILTIIGLIGSVLTLGVGIPLVVWGVTTMMAPISEGTRFTGETRLELPADEDMVLFVEGRHTQVDCQILAPDGERLHTVDADVMGIDEWAPVGGFTTTDAGTYTLSCTPDQIEVVAGTRMPENAPGIYLAGAVLGVVGVLGGLPVTGVGVVLWVAGRARARRLAVR